MWKILVMMMMMMSSSCLPIAQVLNPDLCILDEQIEAMVHFDLEEVPPLEEARTIWCDLEQGPYLLPLDARGNAAFTMVRDTPKEELYALSPAGVDVRWDPIVYTCGNGHDVLLGHDMTVTCSGTEFDGSAEHYIRVRWHWTWPEDEFGSF